MNTVTGGVYLCMCSLAGGTNEGQSGAWVAPYESAQDIANGINEHCAGGGTCWNQ